MEELLKTKILKHSKMGYNDNNKNNKLNKLK